MFQVSRPKSQSFGLGSQLKVLPFFFFFFFACNRAFHGTRAPQHMEDWTGWAWLVLTKTGSVLAAAPLLLCSP